MIAVLKRGDLATWQGDEHWIYAACAETDVGYWCETHSAVMVNREELRAHCSDVEGDHLVARWCSRHGFEAASLPARGET